MDLNIKLDALEGEASEDGKDQLLINQGYANLIRSLMYLTIATQPNIAYLVNKLMQYTLAPKAKHWIAVKRVFRYLKGTRQYKLTYGGSPELLHDENLIFELAEPDYIYSSHYFSPLMCLVYPQCFECNIVPGFVTPHIL